MNNLAIQTALTAPGMFYCPNLSPGPATLSEKQCLFLQARHKVQGFPHSCSPFCVQGAKVRRRHKGAMVPEVQFNVLQGGFVAGNRQVELDSPAPVCPSKRIAQEKQAQPVAYQHERLRKEKVPKCEVHGCRMTKNRVGRWYCDRCASMRSRRGAAMRKGAGKPAPGVGSTAEVATKPAEGFGGPF